MLIAPALPLALIHPTAWKWNSANFAVTEFSELPLLRSIESSRRAFSSGIMLLCKKGYEPLGLSLWKRHKERSRWHGARRRAEHHPNCIPRCPR